MAIPFTIEGTDALGEMRAPCVVKLNDRPNGLVVYSEPLTDLPAATVTLLNPTYGRAMNQSVSFGGTPENVHNGGDAVQWTGSALSGTWDFASATQAHGGTASIDATGANNNSEGQLENSGTIDANAFIALTGWVYVTGWSSSGVKEVEFQLRNAGVDVGGSVGLSDYIDTSLTGGWQSFIIPTVDFASGTIDQIVMRIVSTGGGAAPNVFLDDIIFEENSGFIDFTYAPDPDKRFHLTQVSTIILDNVTEANARDPINLMGVGKLTNGILFSIQTADQVVLSLPARCLGDFVLFAQVEPIQTISDGTTTLLKIIGNTDIVLDGRTKDSFTYRIQDDLSTLLDLQVWLFGRIEDV